MTALKRPLCGIMAFILVFAFLAATPVSVFADDEGTTERPFTPAEIEMNKKSEGGFEYIKVELNSAIEIVGYTGSEKDVEVPKKIGNLSVISIGEGAFEGNTSIETVKLHNSITKISDNAFKGCTSLKEVTKIGAVTEVGVSAFEGCKSLVSFEIPDELTEIPERCFADCASLKEIDVHKNIKGVAKDALTGSGYEKALPNGPLYLGRILYSYKGNVEHIVVPEDISIIEDGAFLGCESIKKLTLGYDVEEIGMYAFQNCTNLTTVEVNEAMGILKAGAFKDCTALKSIDFSESTLASVGYEAFSGCTSLKDIKLSETTSEIGDYAFAHTKITAIEFGKNINSIGANSFIGTCNLKSFTAVDKNKTYSTVDGVLFNKDGNELVAFPAAQTGTYTVPDGVWKIYENAFYGSALSNVKFGKDSALTEIGISAFENSMITSIEIPKGVTKIAMGTFMNAVKLGSVKINDGVVEIGVSAFEGCAALKSIELPVSVYTIANSAFKNAGLESVKTGDGVAKIYTDAFAGNTNLKSVELGKNVESIADNAFGGCSALTAIKIPASLKNFEASAFSGCMSLGTITVDEDNKNYKAIGNLLYTADGKTLLFVGSVSNLADTLTTVTIAEGTEVIAANAFDVAVNTTVISFPTTLKNIEGDALDVTAWMNGKNGVIVAGSVLYKVIGDVHSVTLPAGIKSIAENAVQNASVKEIFNLDTVTYIGNNAFEGSGIESIVLPDTVTYIGNGAFEDCASLKSVTLPAGITVIAPSTFSGCSALLEIIIPDTVKLISTDAFAGCASLTGVDFGTVETIEPYAFADCVSLANVELPKEIDVVDGLVFVGCTGLKNITLSGESKKYKSLDGVLLISSTDENGEYTGKFETIALYPAGREGVYAVPAEVLRIADRAFYNCDAITGITFESGFLSIGAEAFFDCDRIKSVNMPASAESVGDHAFASCDSLVEFIVNSNTTVYAENAFEGCYYFSYDLVTINVDDNSIVYILIVAGILVLIGAIWVIVYNKKQKKIQAAILLENEKREELEEALAFMKAEETTEDAVEEAVEESAEETTEDTVEEKTEE